MSVQPVYAPSTGSGLFGGLSSAMIDLVERVNPSVVQVRNEGRGIGAGVIWDRNGLVITNQHVVAEERGAVSVLLTDGRELQAEVIGRNPTLDLALLKIAANDLPKAAIADSSRVRVGELVFAIGHPWGRRGVATAGIISGLGEVGAPGSRRTSQYIRSDVRLAPGNSGGPMLNAEGEVIGINAMIFGGDLAVAIPSHVATQWVASLSQTASASNSGSSFALGVGVQAVEVRTEKPGEPVKKVAGLLVVTVQSGSPAERNDLRVGDILLEVGNNPLSEVASLKSILANHNPANTLKLRLMRAGAVRTLEIKK